VNQHILIVAGEPSGDMHAAHVVNELSILQPDIRVEAMGGEALRATRAEIIVDNRELAVVGLVEVIHHYPVIRKALKTLESRLVSHPPALLVLVDYVEFNLKLAARAKQLGIPVLFYISPQVWAWRPGRVEKIGQRIDMMAVIFPFETRFYEQHDIPVRYVGNPLVGKVKASRSRAEMLDKLGLDGSRPIVGLQPGSRRSEIERLLPLFLDTARQLQATIDDVQFVMPVAPGIEPALITSQLDGTLPVTLSREQNPYDLMQLCSAILTASGTATLETALMGIPMVIAYKVAPLSYQIFRHLIRIPDIGLVNVVAERRIVAEFIQHDATPDNLTAELVRLLQDREYRTTMIAALARVREKLGDRNGAREMAHLIQEML
jgi:lipid-A-disaccharide synthase